MAKTNSGICREAAAQVGTLVAEKFKHISSLWESEDVEDILTLPRGVRTVLDAVYVVGL